MKNWLRRCASDRRSFIITVICLQFGFGCLPSAGADTVVKDRVIVRIAQGGDADNLARRHGSVVIGQIMGRTVVGLKVPARKNPSQFVQELKSDSESVTVERDRYVTNPELQSKQIHFAFDGGPNPGGYLNQNAYSVVNLAGSNTLSTGGGIIVAIVDTGVNVDHPALFGHMVAGYNAIDPSALPGDSHDGVTNAAVGHGTMLAGVVAKIAPDAQIMPIRALNADGVGTLSNILTGIQWAIDHGARVINLSFSTAQISPILNDFMDEADNLGVVLVAAAGNENSGTRRYPAASPNVISVASVEDDLTKSAYSNFGSYLTVVAPGSGIRSTYWDGGFATWSGTSFSAPFVSAQAVLILAANPTFNGENVADRIRETAHSVNRYNPFFLGKLGAGVINILNSLQGGG